MSAEQVTIGGGAIVTKTSAELDPDGEAVYLIGVKNISTSAEGSYIVQISV